MLRLMFLRLIAVAICLMVIATLPPKLYGFPMLTSKKVVTVTERDSLHTVKIMKGDTLLVRLEAQISTGYGWQITKRDRTRLRSLGAPGVEPGTGLGGGIEHQVFKFRVLKTGPSTLRLEYARPWEKDKPPARTFMVKILCRQ